MPNETQDAVNWALQQSYVWDEGTDMENAVQVTKNTSMELVVKVREYFNTNNIVYDSFSYDDLLPYLSN